MKLRRFTLIALLLSVTLLLTACSALAKAEPQIQSFLDALSAGDTDAARALLHPTLLEEDPEEGLSHLIANLDGRTASDFHFLSVNVNNGIQNSGRFRQESGTCLLTLEDGTKLQLQYIWLSDADGEGFTSFYLYDSAAGSTQATGSAV